MGQRSTSNMSPDQNTKIVKTTHRDPEPVAKPKEIK